MKKRREKKGGPAKPKPRDKRWDWIILAVLGIITVVIFAQFIFTDKMLFGSDMIPMGYMMRKAVADSWRATGTLPLWDPYILCGLPVVDAMHGDLFYPVSALYLLMPVHKAVGYKIVIHVWLAGVAMFLLIRTLGLSRKSAFLAGVGYMVAPYFLSLVYAGHDAKMFVTALFPLSIMLLERLLRGPRLLYAALFGADLDSFEHGFEAFYNFRVTPAVGLTVNAQAIDSTAKSVDTAYTLGTRLQIDF